MPLWLWYSQNACILGSVLVNVKLHIVFCFSAYEVLCQLHGLQCACVLVCFVLYSFGMLQGHVHGPLMMSCGFSVSLLFCCL